MIPVAGSAYTYAYATLGELFAWIIGWDLILEYAMSAAVVAAVWTKYFNKLLSKHVRFARSANAIDETREDFDRVPGFHATAVIEPVGGWFVVSLAAS